jgi:hypothetical protein
MDMPTDQIVRGVLFMPSMSAVYFAVFYVLLPRLIRKHQRRIGVPRLWRNLPGLWLVYTFLFGWIVGSVLALPEVPITPFMAGILLLCLYQGFKTAEKMVNADETPAQE